MSSIRPTDRIVLACSGDLATSVAIPWLREQYGAEIVTVTLDLGQGGALADVRERALAAGAVRAHVIDAGEEFARDFLLPALHAGAIEHGGDRLATRLARLLVARHLVRAAALENAGAVAHAIADAGGSDSVAEALSSLNPRLRVLAPAREWGLTRAAQIDFARARDILVPPAPSLTRAVAVAPDVAASVAIRFLRGLPVAINDVELPLVDLVGSLATMGGSHGVGRQSTDGRPSPAAGYALDASAAVILRTACRELRTTALPAGTLRRFPGLAATMTDLIVRGQWFTPARAAFHARLAETRDHLTGTIRLELFKGSCRVVHCNGHEGRSDETAAPELFNPPAAPPRVATAQA